MKTLIIDNYDSFTFNIYQYVGELGGNPSVLRNDQVRIGEISNQYSHIIISPGPGSPDDPSYFGICMKVIERCGKRIPLLGVCLGHQGIISCFGGKVIRAKSIKHGKQSLIQHTKEGIFSSVKNPLHGMRYHSLVGKRDTIPSELQVIATSMDDGEIMGIKHKTYPIFGVQFHPESIGTTEGKKIFYNFLTV